MKRSEIRYAMFRIKAGTPDKKHLDLFKTYKEQLDEFELTIEDFTTEWDIDKVDFSKLVIGKQAKIMNREKSLFDSKGAIKE